MTKTPRTDAAMFTVTLPNGETVECVTAEFARELEVDVYSWGAISYDRTVRLLDEKERLKMLLREWVGGCKPEHPESLLGRSVAEIGDSQ